MNPDNIPNWVLFLAFFLICLFGSYLGGLDYRDQRADECYLQGKSYDESADICINQVRSK